MGIKEELEKIKGKTTDSKFHAIADILSDHEKRIADIEKQLGFIPSEDILISRNLVKR